MAKVRECVWCDGYWVCGTEPSCNPSWGSAKDKGSWGCIKVGDRYFEVQVGMVNVAKQGKKQTMEPIVRLEEVKESAVDGNPYAKAGAVHLKKKPKRSKK